MNTAASEYDIRERMCALALSLFNRGYAVGGAGNLSARLPDGHILVTPTNASLGRLVPERLAKVALDGTLLAGDPPSKEAPFHLAAYRRDTRCGAIAHLHSTYLTALSCLEGLDSENVLRPFTPYYVMRVGRLILLPYFRPGSPEIAAALEARMDDSCAFLLANHGSIVIGRDIVDAVNNAEELEETAKLHFTLGQSGIRYLSENQIEELQAKKKTSGSRREIAGRAS